MRGDRTSRTKPRLLVIGRTLGEALRGGVFPSVVKRESRCASHNICFANLDSLLSYGGNTLTLILLIAIPIIFDE